MGFQVSFYAFSKKNNSTLRPGGASVTYSCRIKEPTGVFNPSMVIDMGLTTSPSSYNYAYIPTFDRYYYVREWTMRDGLWIASMEVDVLASWKQTIGASECYVLRSAVEYDLDVMDMTYPGTNNTTTIDQQMESPWITDSIDNGMFVVGVAGQSTTYYLFTPSGLDLFLEYLFSDMYIDDLVGDWATVFPQLKAQANPLQFITSIMWIPFITTGSSVSTIRVGFVDVPCVAWKVSGSGIRAGTLTFPVQKHPQVVRGDYLGNAPFSSYSIFFPPWGTIPLDPDIVNNSFSIGVIWYMDLRTGKGTMVITGGPSNTHIMSWTHSQIGVNYQVSQVLNQGFGAGNLIGPALSAASMPSSPALAGAAAISGGLSAIGDLAKSSIPSATTIGSSGGIDSLRGIPTMQYEFKQIVSEDLAHRGRPLCMNKTISSLSGYILVKDADIAIPCTLEEQDKIRNYMEGGFFYE